MGFMVDRAVGLVLVELTISLFFSLLLTYSLYHTHTNCPEIKILTQPFYVHVEIFYFSVEIGLCPLKSTGGVKFTVISTADQCFKKLPSLYIHFSFLQKKTVFEVKKKNYKKCHFLSVHQVYQKQKKNYSTEGNHWCWADHLNCICK